MMYFYFVGTQYTGYNVVRNPPPLGQFLGQIQWGGVSYYGGGFLTFTKEKYTTCKGGGGVSQKSKKSVKISGRGFLLWGGGFLTPLYPVWAFSPNPAQKTVFSRGIFSQGVCAKNLKLCQSVVVTVVLCFSIFLFLQKKPDHSFLL